MRDFRAKYADELRQKWLESLERCNKLFAYYNTLTDEIITLRDSPVDIDDIDIRRYKDLIDQRLLCEADLVSARSECRKAYRDYYFEFPFLAAFEELGGADD